jgi:acetaldehyde dehydrogenase/alcohol dehydrogenase
MGCSSYGAIGDIYNFHLAPSLTLGCGSKGGNSTSENVGPMNLLNIKNIVEKRENMLWFKVGSVALVQHSGNIPGTFREYV